MPAKSEKRTATRIEGRLTCGALVRAFALDDAVKVPDRRVPFACTGRKPGCNPNRSSNARRASRLRGSGCAFFISGPVIVVFLSQKVGNGSTRADGARFLAGSGGEGTNEPSGGPNMPAVRRAPWLGFICALVDWRGFLQGCEQNLRARRHLHGPLLKYDVLGAYFFAVQIPVAAIVRA